MTDTCKKCGKAFHWNAFGIPLLENQKPSRDFCDVHAMFDPSEFSVGDTVKSRKPGIGLTTITPKGEISTIFRIRENFIEVEIKNRDSTVVGYSVPRSTFNESYERYYGNYVCTSECE